MADLPSSSYRNECMGLSIIVVENKIPTVVGAGSCTTKTGIKKGQVPSCNLLFGNRKLRQDDEKTGQRHKHSSRDLPQNVHVDDSEMCYITWGTI